MSNTKRTVALGIVGGLGAIAIAAYNLFQKRSVNANSVVTIDPSVTERPVRRWADPVVPEVSLVAPRAAGSKVHPIFERAPHELPGFGLDLSRNVDEVGVDDYMNLPLESEGKTHLNRHVYEEVEEGEIVEKDTTPRVRYIRITVKATRGDSLITRIGGMKFFYGNQLHRDGGCTLWNPHSGERIPYEGGEWVSDDQKMVVVCFSELVAVNRYEFKASGGSVAEDPASWTLEGSKNGTFWLQLDTRVNAAFPEVRGASRSYLVTGVSP